MPRMPSGSVLSSAILRAFCEGGASRARPPSPLKRRACRPCLFPQEGERPDEWFYHWKSEELVKHNPSALVPTLIDTRGRSVYESLVCIDFVDAVSGAIGKDRLVPDDPVEAARCRVWADKVLVPKSSSSNVSRTPNC